MPGGVLELARARGRRGRPLPVLCIAGGADRAVLTAPPAGLQVVSLTARFGRVRARGETLALLGQVTAGTLSRLLPLSGPIGHTACAARPAGTLPAALPGTTGTQRGTRLARGGITMGLLDGKVAVVTGAGRGIGREEALLLAAEGARVVVNDVGAGLHGEGSGDVHPAEEVVALIRERGGEAAVNGDDISSWAGGKQVVEQAIDTFGSLDILVNNAGILRDKMSFNMEESDWDDVIRVHLKGHFAATHHAAVYWRNRAKAGEDVTGRIINTTSESGLFGNAGQANYAAAKAGIASLTLVEARELGRYGVTSNAVAPRARTRMTETLFGGEQMNAPEGVFDEWDPKNIANVVAFLAAPASADISGQILVVFGASIWAMSAYQAVGRLTRDTAWSPEELIAAKDDLFQGISSGVPPFSFI